MLRLHPQGHSGSGQSLWTYVAVGCVGFVTGYATHSLVTRYIKEKKPERERQLNVSELYIYPVKACKGVKVTSARITARGFENDRLFLVVDFTGRFMTQRKSPSMALIAPQLSPDASKLTLTAPGMDPMHVHVAEGGDRKEVTCWDDVCTGVDQGDDVGRWLSTFLDQPGLRLVKMEETFVRPVDKVGKYVSVGKYQVSFADGYPYLLTTAESHKAVSQESTHDIPVNRFRPNIVVSGAIPAFEEDSWQKVTISIFHFDVAKLCDRCKVPQVNQVTGKFEGPEPTSTLKQLKKQKVVTFGVNVVTASVKGVIKVGDPVHIDSMLRN